MEDAKELIKEVQAGVAEIVTPAITKDVMEQLSAKIAEQKTVVVDADTKAFEAKKASVAMFKDMASELENGAKVVSKSLDTTTAESGAEIVPEYFASEVLRVTESHGIARQDARVVPMTGKTLEFPTMGSISVYRVSEKGKIPVVTPTTGDVKLTAKKLAAIIPMSKEVLAYTHIALVDEVAKLAGEAMARAEDTWAFLGLSAGEGILQNASVPVHTLTAGKTSYADTDFADMLALQNLIDDHAFAEGNLKYYMSRSVFNALRAIVSSNDDRHIFQAPGAGMPPTIWNLPVQNVAVLPQTSDEDQEGTAYAGLYNLQHLLMGASISYELEMSREATIGTYEGGTTINLWEQDMVAIRVMESVDFQLSNADKAFATLQTASDLS